MAKKASLRARPRLADAGGLTPAQLASGTDLADGVLSGDLSESEIEDSEIAACLSERAQLTGGVFSDVRLVDCEIVDSDLSGVTLEDCTLTRVEFRSCRLLGLQAAGARFVDVGFTDCRMDGANFRMTAWERAELSGCSL